MNNMYDEKTGLPDDKSYLECGLPDWLQKSIDRMAEIWEQLDRGEENYRWDCYYCELQSDINVAEIEQIISSEQARYLREKYLRISRSDDI